MTPAKFREFVYGIAKRLQIPFDQVLLGGDHLGPNSWRNESSEIAMAKSEVMVADYVRSGFLKIHLDCSMSCADDPVPLDEEVIAKRAARLCAVAEQAWAVAGGEAPVYIIGTEVPVPGGAHEDLTELAVTSAVAAANTIHLHRQAFAAAGLHEALSRVVALVVQPGVEFDHHKVIDYVPVKARELSAFIESEPSLVYEAHSTDYQTSANLKSLVRDHFAILKVGPGVTFAMRETLWALADVEREWLGPQGSANLKQAVHDVMLADPSHWRAYYQDAARLNMDLQYSLSDRIRYYWPHPAIQQACQTMLNNLGRTPPPLTLLSQYLPEQYHAIREGRLAFLASDIVRDGVGSVLRHYLNACNPHPENTR
jgi:D-tagatose-1,6-bisphosphate aldolase subunit GatZ/KbaZ